MNQFKKAKQKALASGHHVENIGDLKTAGVKEATVQQPEIKTEEVQKAEPSIVETPPATVAPKELEKIQEKQEELNDTSIIEEAISQPEIPSMSTPAEEIHTIQPEPHEELQNMIEHTPTIQATNTVQSPDTTITGPTIPTPIPETVKQHPIQNIIASEPEHTVEISEQSGYLQEGNIEPQSPVYSAQPINHEQPVYQTEQVVQPATVQSPVQVTPQIISQQPVSDEISQQSHVVQIKETVAAPAYIPAEPEYTEPMNLKRTNSKKSIPNIFSPKGEAKSMRKSLVLKPTSVKIAENYCAKNGGSFNELIQTLLDNFIDEYGL